MSHLCVFNTGDNLMPHTFNRPRRHSVDKTQYRVIHWAEYRESPLQRGDRTIWVSEEVQSAWSTPCRTLRDIWIETQIGPAEGRHRPQTPIPQLLQANHGDPGRPESSEHNDRTRTACVRTYRLTLRLGKGRIPSPTLSMQQRCEQGRLQSGTVVSAFGDQIVGCSVIGYPSLLQ